MSALIDQMTEPNVLFTKVKAEVLAKHLTETDCDGWKYVVEYLHTDKYAVSVFDECGNHLGYF